MAPYDILTKETILAALRRMDELLREQGVIGEKMYDAAEVCDHVAKYYSERLLAPKVRFFIEEVVEEIRP